MDYYDIWYDIYNMLSKKDKLAFAFINKNTNTTDYPIYDIFYFRHLFLFNKSQIRKIEISMGSQINFTDYPYLTYLKSSISYAMPNLYHMKNLKTLKLGHYCAVSDYMIKDLDLVHLEINGNPGITTVSHMKNLKVLRLKNNHSITLKTKEPLDLIELKLKNEMFTFDLSKMKNLKILSLRRNLCRYEDYIKPLSLKDLDLYSLSLENYTVNDISFMKNLKYLKGEDMEIFQHKMNLLRNYKNRKHIEYFYDSDSLLNNISYWKEIHSELCHMRDNKICLLDHDINDIEQRIKSLEGPKKFSCSIN